MNSPIVKYYKQLALHIIIACVSILFLVKSSPSLTMQFIVTMPPVITKGTVTEFDIFGEGTGAQVFIILLSNADAQAYTGLTLRYRVDYLPGDGGPDKRLYEGVSYTFDMAPYEQVPPISSTDFLKKDNHAVKVSLTTTLYELSNSDPLKQQFLDTQRIPDGRVRYSMRLLQNLVTVDEQTSEHTILNTSTVELLAPGATPSASLPTEFNTVPLFVWTSDLPPNIYGNDDVFQIHIYKAKSGESAVEAMSRIPVVDAGTKTTQYQIPVDKYQLVPGATYYWEVLGYVRGLSTSTIRSGPFGFTVAKPINLEFWEVVNTLKQIYGDDILEKIYAYDAAVTVRNDGQTIDIQELRALVQKIMAEEYSVQSTDVD